MSPWPHHPLIQVAGTICGLNLVYLIAYTMGYFVLSHPLARLYLTLESSFYLLVCVSGGSLRPMYNTKAESVARQARIARILQSRAVTSLASGASYAVAIIPIPICQYFYYRVA